MSFLLYRNRYSVEEIAERPKMLPKFLFSQWIVCAIVMSEHKLIRDTNLLSFWRGHGAGFPISKRSVGMKLP